MFYLTYSNTKAFRDCPYKFYLRYIQQLRSVITSDALRLGSAFHEGREGGEQALEEYLEGFHPRTQEELDSHQIITTIAKGLLSIAPRDEGIRREVEWEMPLINPETGRSSRTFALAGKIDGILGADLVEEKTRGQSPQKSDIDRLPLDAQILMYVNACGFHDIDIRRVRYRYYIRPGIRRRKDKNHPTGMETLSTFLDRLEACFVDEPERYFREEILHFPKEALEKFREDIWAVGQGILWFRNNNCWYRNTTHCSDYGGCEYLPLCRGEDVEGLYKLGEPNVELGEDKRGSFTTN